MQAQFIETMILLIINHQSLIATKASRIVRAAAGRPVMEFGTRRAHGASAAIYGARAAYIGGDVYKRQVMVLHTLAVDPECSGRGYGGKFIDFYEKYASENGCDYLRIDTNVKNTIARHIYEKHGYSLSLIHIYGLKVKLAGCCIISVTAIRDQDALALDMAQEGAEARRCV